MGINFAAASTAGLNNPGTEIITLVKDGSGNFINPPSFDKMLAYLRSGEVPMLFVTTEGGETGSLYQLDEYSETENKISFNNDKTTIAFSAGASAPVVSDVVPKPMTYDYMPEGYPKKSRFNVEWDGNTDGLTVLEVASSRWYKVSDSVVDPGAFASGATLTYASGNTDFMSIDSALPKHRITIEPGKITFGEGQVAIITEKPPDDTFEIGVYFESDDKFDVRKVTGEETITPMAEEFIPNILDVDSIIIKSSTTGSTKKFKITVDDSGTISATEVT